MLFEPAPKDGELILSMVTPSVDTCTWIRLQTRVCIDIFYRVLKLIGRTSSAWFGSARDSPERVKLLMHGTRVEQSKDRIQTVGIEAVVHSQNVCLFPNRFKSRCYPADPGFKGLQLIDGTTSR